MKLKSQTKAAIVGGLFLTSCFASVHASAACSMTMEFPGEQVKSSISCYSLDAQVEGAGTSKNQSIVLRKPIDRASPLLAQGMTNNEPIYSVTIECRFQADSDGREEQYYTIQLENATVASVRVEQLNNKYPQNSSDAVPQESFSLNFERIRAYP